jgi:hypothetical protein
MFFKHVKKGLTAPKYDASEVAKRSTPSSSWASSASSARPSSSNRCTSAWGRSPHGSKLVIWNPDYEPKNLGKTHWTGATNPKKSTQNRCDSWDDPQKGKCPTRFQPSRILWCGAQENISHNTSEDKCKGPKLNKVLVTVPICTSKWYCQYTVNIHSYIHTYV